MKLTVWASVNVVYITATHFQGWKIYGTIVPVFRKYLPRKKKIDYCKNLDKRKNSAGKF
jgi:hypothetical protein